MSNVTALKPRPVTAWLSPEQVCDRIPGMTTRKLQRFRDEGTGPRYSKLGRTIVYAEADIAAWVDGHLVATKDQS